MTDAFVRRQYLTMDMVDTIRRKRQQVDQALAQEAQDAQLAASLRDFYAASGNTDVTDDIIQEAIQAAKENRYSYVPPQHGWAVRWARVYVSRARWWPRVRRGALIGLAGGLVVMGAAWGVHYSRYRSLLSEVNQMVQATHQREEALDALTAQLAQVDDSTLAQTARAQLQAQRQRLALAVPQPVAPWVQAHPDTARRVWVTHTQALAATDPAVAVAAVDQAQAWSDARRHQAQQHLPEGLTDDVREALTGRWHALSQAVSQGLAAQTPAGLRTAQSALAHMDQLNPLMQTLSSAQAQVNALPDAARAQGRAYWTQALALAGNGETEAASASLTQLAALERQVGLSYALRISDRPGERSGVWRHPNGDEQARAYYLVVDALGPDGQPVLLPIESVETKRTTMTSHFAVRVPESAYNAVKADKLDNGLIDHPLVAEKAAGAVTPTYAVPVEGGFITEW